MSNKTEPKTALREFIKDLMITLNIKELNDYSDIILSYIDFYLSSLTDEQAQNLLIGLNNVCKLAKKYIKAIQDDN